MPSLGADMDAGTLLEWLVKPGDTVHKGDIVAVVDTSKAAIEVETFQDGVIEDLLVTEGTTVPVGTPLATIGSGHAPAHVPTARKPRKSRKAMAAPTAGAAGHEVQPTGAAPTTVATAPPAPVRVSSPLVRRRAAELGIDLGTVTGTGRAGVVTRADLEALAREVPTRQHPRTRITPYARKLAAELGVDLTTLTHQDGAVRAFDVRRAAESTPPHPAVTARQPAERSAEMRLTIARLMARSKREIPHYYLSTTVDLHPAMTWMHERNLDLPLAERLVPAALLLKATALAARKHPELNGFWVDDAFMPGPGVHLGVAVSLRGGGLVAPALHDAADLAVKDLMVALRDVVARARSGRLRSSELSDPTMTVTNLGDQGVEAVFGVIYPPQVALVGFGRIVEQPRAVDGLLGIRPVTMLTLAADHRATDGFTGARFLDTIDQLLQQPEEL